jgi:microsomal dipeptidase-like Zn-dependent dipeptidase
VVEAMVDINQQTPKGDFSNIAIGSDFDGFADQCSDLYVPSQLSTLVDAMKNPDKYNVPKDKQHEFTDEEIRMVFYKNAQRLLEKGWT